jgi:MtN3 and saliva related transmembrane protein
MSAMHDVRADQVNRNRLNKPALGALCIGLLALAGCGEWAVHDVESLLVPSLQRSEVIGLVAGFGTTFAVLPDLISMLRRRSTKGMHPRMAAILGAFQILWVYYGLLIVSRPVIVWNAIAVATNFFSVGAYYYFARGERRIH